jgi:hypothetical protein
MTPAQIAVIAVVVIALIAVVAVVFIMRKRTEKLRAQFGPEYDRAVAMTGNRFKAEAQLEKAEERVRRYSLRPLTAVDRERFQKTWRMIQATFVDDPPRAFTEADQLVGAVMLARGYPPTDFDNRAAEIAVDHAAVVENYRAGHEVAILHAQRLASTEELRRGMVHFRTLFEELMQEEPAPLRARAVGST